MPSRTSVRRIVSDQVGTFYRLPNHSRDTRAVVVYLILPPVVALVVTAFGFTIGDEFYPNLLTVAAVLVGLLLNALMLVQTIRIEPEGPRAKERWALRDELRTNISFAVVVAIFLVGIVVLGSLLPDSVELWGRCVTINPILTAAALAAIFLLGPAILIVLKRMYVLVSTEPMSAGGSSG